MKRSNDDNKKSPLFQNEFTASRRIIYTPSTFARSALLYLQEIGELTSLRPHVSARSKLPSYLFFIVTKGKGTLEYHGNRFDLSKGDCVFIDCKEGYSQCASEHKNSSGEFDELWSLSWVHFDGATMEAIYSKYKERGGKPVFGAAEQTRYRDLIEEIVKIVDSESYVRDVRIAEKLTELISFLMEDAWEQESSEVHTAPKRGIVKDIKNYIDENYKESMALQSLANKFYINKEYLSKIFKDVYGYTVNGYISHVRVAKAKSLLRFTEMTVEQIGAEVGINDPNYFSRMFKRVEGVSPKTYRESW